MATTRQALLKLNKILSKLNISVQFSNGDFETVKYIPDNFGAQIYVEFPSYKSYLNKRNTEFIDSHLVQTIAHEIGHYLIAPPKRRKQEDYGVKIKSGIYSEKVNTKYELEEIKAQAIEREIYDKIGYNLNFKIDWRTRKDDKFDVTRWWQSQGKQLVDNMFYILGI